jgi:hypothetical protein
VSPARTIGHAIGGLREPRHCPVIRGPAIPEEPRLYLWGLRVDDDSVVSWDLLTQARERFEQNLPVKRPLLEPDTALRLPGRYLILIEATFTGVSPLYTDGPRRNAKSLTKAELIEIYWNPALKIIDVASATRARRIHTQLRRNMVFAEWMALADSPGTRAYQASVTRLSEERESCDQFQELLHPGFAGRFVHRIWEEIDDLWLSARLPSVRRPKSRVKDHSLDDEGFDTFFKTNCSRTTFRRANPAGKAYPTPPGSGAA